MALHVAQRYGRLAAARWSAVYSGPVCAPLMSGREAAVLRR
jgi:hypothetical protein